MIRIGAVRYLNSKPLLEGLCERDGVRVEMDYPSRLADRLAAGELDVALVPSVEVFRGGFSVISDACVATLAEVLSVKLYGRVAPEDIQRLALDEGSRTSAALARVLLAERYDIAPQIEPFFLESSVADSDADAVLVIGDRAMKPPPGDFEFVWDLGAEWLSETGLPFVFAVWASRDLPSPSRAAILEEARDAGISQLGEIAARECAELGIPQDLAHAYLAENLHFHLGERETLGLETFQTLCIKHGLLPEPGETLDCGPRKHTRSTSAR